MKKLSNFQKTYRKANTFQGSCNLDFYVYVIKPGFHRDWFIKYIYILSRFSQRLVHKIYIWRDIINQPVSVKTGLNDIDIYIYMERYNKSTMPVNAEKYFMTHLGFKLRTSATPPSTALSVTSTNCAIETTQ